MVYSGTVAETSKRGMMDGLDCNKEELRRSISETLATPGSNARLLRAALRRLELPRRLFGDEVVENGLQLGTGTLMRADALCEQKDDQCDQRKSDNDATDTES